jgi:HPt (histidine-containing phosphotransfer) domain-containing protein
MTDELRELQRDYLAEVRLTVDRMREHGRDLGETSGFKSSFPELLFLAHQLKGSGGSLGFARITQLAQRMGEELNFFLDEQRATRPTPEQLSETLLALSSELESEVNNAQQTLK